jgi:hypothetical protein
MAVETIVANMMARSFIDSMGITRKVRLKLAGALAALRLRHTDARTDVENR